MMPMPTPDDTSPRDIVLVVDDSPGSLGMVTDALEGAGYTVLVATDGPSAIRIVERATPDIILMDALMPGMDGFQTCRDIKARPGMSNVPVIFMTGLKDTESVIKGLSAGGVDYVTKPAAPDEILARIKVHLANARLASSAHAALDTSGRFLLAVDPQGAVRWLTPQAGRLLAEDGAQEQVILPVTVTEWLRQTFTSAGEARAFRLTILRGGRSRTLEFSLVGQIGPGEYLLRLVEASAADPTARLRQHFGVTMREAEVLLWLSRGKQNRDIADILGMSPRTVNKHLEQIYAKIGVENRATAATMAVSALHDLE